VRKLIIAVLVIVALAVAADFGAAAAAEYTVAKQMRQQLHLAGDPSVRINGFPFLTQAVTGHYTAIDIEASGVSSDPLHDLDVQATLHNVDAPPTVRRRNCVASLWLRAIWSTRLRRPCG